MLQSMVVSCLSIVGIVQFGPKWTDDYSEALNSARNSHRPLVVVLELPTARTAQVDRLKKVSPSILMRYEVCHVDATSNYGKKIADLYGATELPYTVITDTDCREILFRGTGTISTQLLTQTLATHAPADVQQFGNEPLETKDEPLQVASLSTVRPRTVRKLVPADTQPRASGTDSSKSPLEEGSADNRDLPAFSHTGLDAAQAASEQSQRPMLVVISMQNCHFCDKLKAETLSETLVKAQIADKFESVMIQDTDQPTWVEEQGISIFPTTLIVSSTGNLIDRIEGFVGPEQLSARLNNVQANLYSSR